jgi:enoyl-CoA hydratase/carnithine racemase
MTSSATHSTDDLELTHLRLERPAEGVVRLVLDNPDMRNAMSDEMTASWVAAIDALAVDPTVRVVVVTGEGTAFCSGGNTSWIASEPDAGVDRLRTRMMAFYRAWLSIRRLEVPTIAAINGPAVGIGATMTLAMDLRLASTKARIGFVFGRLGIVPEACSTWFLPRLVGPQRALEWIYSAEILTAEQALEGGLLRSVHEPDDLLPTALELARSFVKDRSPMALALAKQMVYRNGAAAHPLEAHLSDSLAMYWTSMGDGKEGVAAFLDKRAPEFTRKASQAPRIYPT